MQTDILSDVSKNVRAFGYLYYVKPYALRTGGAWVPSISPRSYLMS